MTDGHSQLSVLHIAISLNPGGAERSIIDLVTRLAPRMPTAVCCLEEAGAWAPELERQGVEVMGLQRTPGFHPSLSRRIAAIMRDRNVNTLHCHQYTPFVYGQLAALMRGNVRVVFTEQGRLSDTPPSRKRRLVNPLLGRLPDRIYAVSADLRQYMIAEGLPASRIGVIYNAIDGSAPAPSDSERLKARAPLGIEHDAFVVGTAARLDPVKDLPRLVEAIARVRTQVPNVQLVIVGEGPDRARIEEAIQTFQVGPVVHLLGYRSDVRQILPAFDVYVNCSVSEGISLTILEAMASALPVVATRVGGNPEVVAESDTGRLVPARDAERLAAALVDLARVPEERRRMGHSGRQRLERVFTIERMVERYIDAYRGKTNDGLM